MIQDKRWIFKMRNAAVFVEPAKWRLLNLTRILKRWIYYVAVNQRRHLELCAL